MKLLIYMADGRTVYLLEKRSRLYELAGPHAEPWHERPSVRVARGTWSPITGEYLWEAIGIRFIRRHGIARVEEAPHGLADVVQQDLVAEALA